MTGELERTLAQVRADVHRARVLAIPTDVQSFDTPARVRSQLVDPILAALGWRLDNPEEVREDFRFEGHDVVPSLALFESGNPCFLVEIRGLGREYERERVVDGLLPLLGDFGFEWLLMTDGDDYAVFNARGGVPVEHRAFDAVRLSVDSPARALEFFNLLARQRLSENRIESLRKCSVIDQQVRESLAELFAPDSELVQLLLKKTRNLSAREIRSSLSRTTVDVQYDYHDMPEAATEVEKKRCEPYPTAMSDAELRVATWLQQRSIERWAKGAERSSRNQGSQQRRSIERRRSGRERRSGINDRRVARTARAEERRTNVADRRKVERRVNAERRMVGDRRRTQARA